MLVFWKKHPALFAGLSLLLGSAAALCFTWALAAPAYFLWGKSIRSFLIGTLIAAGAYFYTLFTIPNPVLPDTPIEGIARMHITALQHHSSPFQKSLVYKGYITKFTTPSQELYMRMPCWIYSGGGKKRPLANTDYLIEGTLQPKQQRHSFKPNKKKSWEPIQNTHSFAEWRYKAKENIRSYLKTHIPHADSYKLLATLGTGDIEERMLAFTFGRLGLKHILAISGFHFALLAACLHVFLRAFLNEKISAAILLGLMSFYFFFIGNSPSVQRAWIAISLVLIGKICNRRTPALNALGLGLIIEILIDPTLITACSFQLSFLATCALLIVYPLIEKLILPLLPKRPLHCVATMDSLNSWGYILSSWTRKTLALTLSVHIATLPLLLCLFHQFSTLSLIYNLFFPIGVSISLCLLLFSIPIHLLIPPLGSFLHNINSFFTAKLLLLTSYPPTPLQYTFYNSFFSPTITLITLTLLFSLCIHNVRRN